MPATLLQTLTELEVDYWHDVDRHWGRGAHEFYTEDGVFIVGDQTMAGRGAVADFYRWRQDRGDRTARHLVSNFRLASADDGRATFECVMCLYAADGKPVLESKPAILMADVTSDCVFGKDGRWRYALHRLTPVFMGGVLPTMPPGKP